MITFTNLSNQEPYKELKKKYEQAISANQGSIEAIMIASFSHKKNEVDSRLVNLKSVNNEDFIFFTNYESPKSLQFLSHDQISAVLFWPAINLQIRMKAKIKKVSEEYSNNYFKTRSLHKNALAISSNQSKDIRSYQEVIDKYNAAFKDSDQLTKRPIFWGGYSFKPYYFEFWEGHKSRLNKRITYTFLNKEWERSILEP